MLVWCKLMAPVYVVCRRASCCVLAIVPALVAQHVCSLFTASLLVGWAREAVQQLLPV
jgi:hypothetical protein